MNEVDGSVSHMNVEAQAEQMALGKSFEFSVTQTYFFLSFHFF